MMGSVYHKFLPGDVFATVVNAQPRVSAFSGSSGWVSGSTSLYSGIRSRSDVGRASSTGVSIYPMDPTNTRDIDGIISMSGSYPSTASLSFVTMKDDAPASWSPVVEWHDEHFMPIMNLYEYYSRVDPGYSTGVFDYYALRFVDNGVTDGRVVVFDTDLADVTSSFTVEARVCLTLFDGVDKNIMSQKDRWRLTMSTNDDAYAILFYNPDSGDQLQSDDTDVIGSWHHFAYSYDGTTGTGSLYIDGTSVLSGDMGPSLASSLTSKLVVGGNDDGDADIFDGLIYETRVWGRMRTDEEISGSFDRRLTDDEVASPWLKHYARFDDGPCSTAHGQAEGSGVFDYSTYANHGTFQGFSSSDSIIWTKNDDESFTTDKKLASGTMHEARVLNVPSIFCGRGIITGSLRIECDGWSTQDAKRVILDDGRGSLYLSGSIFRDVNDDDRRGVTWNRVGNVFYSEGIIVITEPSLLDFGDDNDADDSDHLLSVSFKGDSRIPTKTFMCRMLPAQCNASSNPTFSEIEGDADNDRFIVKKPGETYASAIGIYNEERKLVMVAKLARPLRKRDRDKVNIHVKLDM